MMSQSVAKVIRHGSFWLSLILHLLILLSFLLIVSKPVLDERRPELYIPSYISSPDIKASMQPAPTETVKPQPSRKTAASVDGIEKPAAKSASAKSLPTVPAKSPARSTPQYQSMSPSLERQGIHLLGDEKIDKSLRTILGKAIGAHLYYPRSAIEFGVKGTVLVGFTLHPDGQVTDIQLVKPSSAGILNSAALAAINEISPVDGVWEYVKAPRFLVVGIIFD